MLNKKIFNWKLLNPLHRKHISKTTENRINSEYYVYGNPLKFEFVKDGRHERGLAIYWRLLFNGAIPPLPHPNSAGFKLSVLLEILRILRVFH